MLIGYAGGGVRNIFVNKPVHNLAEIKALKVRAGGADLPHVPGRRHGATVIAYNEVQRDPEQRDRKGENDSGRRSDEVLRSGAASRDDRACDHDPPDLLLDQDFKEPALKTADDHQGRQGSRCLAAIMSAGDGARRPTRGRPAFARCSPIARERSCRPYGGLRQGDRCEQDLRGDQRDQVTLSSRVLRCAAGNLPAANFSSPSVIPHD